jgi:hypothetical protein
MSKSPIAAANDAIICAGGNEATLPNLKSKRSVIDIPQDAIKRNAPIPPMLPCSSR